MKLKLYSIVAVFFMLFSGCSKDDDFKLLEPEIVFVNSDGTSVLDGWCLDSSEKYALQITLKSNDKGTFDSKKKIEYTINGEIYSVTFTELGTKTIPLNFIEGTNVAQLIANGSAISIDVTFCDAAIVAKKINFVYADGSGIVEGECLDLNLDYAIYIETEIEGDGGFETVEIEYTVNGATHSMVFNESGNKLNPVNIIGGTNTAQVVGASLESSIYFSSQGEFELVE